MLHIDDSNLFYDYWKNMDIWYKSMFLYIIINVNNLIIEKNNENYLTALIIVNNLFIYKIIKWLYHAIYVGDSDLFFYNIIKYNLLHCNLVMLDLMILKYG